MAERGRDALRTLSRQKGRGTARLDRNHLITAVAGVFEVLEIFGRTADPVSFTEIVRQTRKPKGSVHRVVSTLMNLGVIAQMENGKYRLTLKLWGLGMVAFAGMDLVKIAQPAVQAMMEAANETAHLAVLDGPDCATYLCKAETPRTVRVQFWVGKRVPSWRSATGRSMLAFRPDQFELLTQQASPELAKELGELVPILKRSRSYGYALTKGDNHPDLGGIAAPVRDYTQNVVASCGIAVPTFRLTRRLVQQCIPIVLETAARISRDLGYTATREVARRRDVIVPEQRLSA